MNYTKSGIVAIGAPNSLARTLHEVTNALDKDLILLLLTEEGREAAQRFSMTEGCLWEEMSEEAKAELLVLPHAWQFFTGVAWALSKIV